MFRSLSIYLFPSLSSPSFCLLLSPYLFISHTLSLSDVRGTLRTMGTKQTLKPSLFDHCVILEKKKETINAILPLLFINCNYVSEMKVNENFKLLSFLALNLLFFSYPPIIILFFPFFRLLTLPSAPFSIPSSRFFLLFLVLFFVFFFMFFFSLVLLFIFIHCFFSLPPLSSLLRSLHPFLLLRPCAFYERR